MTHSGSRLERLDLHSCRHISHEALADVFDGKKQYPFLRDIDLSFVMMVDEEVMAGDIPQLSQSEEVGCVCVLQCAGREDSAWDCCCGIAECAGQYCTG